VSKIFYVFLDSDIIAQYVLMVCKDDMYNHNFESSTYSGMSISRIYCCPFMEQLRIKWNFVYFCLL